MSYFLNRGGIFAMIGDTGEDQAWKPTKKTAANNQEPQELTTAEREGNIQPSGSPKVVAGPVALAAAAAAAAFGNC